MLVVCGLSLAQSGLLNPCLNCTGDRFATGSQVLDRNVLNFDYFDQLVLQLHQIGEEI